MNYDDTDKGLRYISQQFLQKVKEKKKTTYDEVANEIVDDIYEDGCGSVSKKNIRRRAYDALNVLSAVELVEKEKKVVRWNRKSIHNEEDIDALQKERELTLIRIQEKKKYLQELKTQQANLESLLKRNESFSLVCPERSKIHLPFIIISTKENTEIQCEITLDRSKCVFSLNNSFEIHDDFEILQRMKEETNALPP